MGLGGSHARRRIGLSSIALAVVFLIGLGLLLYPTVSNWWNSRRQSQAIVEYTEQTSAMDEAHVSELLEAARQYNEGLAADEGRFTPTPADTTEYEHLLDVSDTGIMGYLEIPKLDVSTPIYHGTDASVLQSGAGHLEGSSLPVGGKGTHTVLSGHRGLPSSKLFTDLDDMEQGDVFMIHVLDRTLTYQVDQIVTVDPYDMDDLANRSGSGLLHAGHVHAVRHQHATTAGARAPHTEPDRRTGRRRARRRRRRPPSASP